MSHEILSQDLASLAAERPEAPRLDPSDAAALAASLSYGPAELPAGAWEELEAKLVANDEAPRVSLSCTYCHDGLSTSGAQAVAYCASCLAPHHPDCFEDHARCSALGCAETRWVQPQSSGAAPARVAGPAGGKPGFRVIAGEGAPASDSEPRRRAIPAMAWVLAASFLGVGAAALNVVRSRVETPIAAAPNRSLVLAYARDLPAGAFVTADDVLQKEMGSVAYETLRASDDPPVSESDLAGFLGRRLESRVFEGQPVRVRQFRTSTFMTPGATLVALVFTHDVQAGEVLRQDDLEPRQIAWSQIWDLPGEGLIHQSHVSAYVGRRLTSRGKGGDPIRLAHFEQQDPFFNEGWEPTPAERALLLSKQGERLLRLARPVERARAYLIHHALAEKVDLEQVEIVSYCPPQPTVYSWLVTFPNPGGEPIYVAVSEAGRTWQLDAQFKPVRGAEFDRGGLLPSEAKVPRRR